MSTMVQISEDKIWVLDLSLSDISQEALYALEGIAFVYKLGPLQHGYTETATKYKEEGGIDAKDS